MQVEISYFQLERHNSGEYRSCNIAYYDISIFIHICHWEQKIINLKLTKAIPYFIITLQEICYFIITN